MLGSSVGMETDLVPGQRVVHVKDPHRPGTVRFVEDNKLSVMVAWDDCDGDGGPDDFQWANKVVPYEVPERKYQSRADLELIGAFAVYPGHPLTIAYIIAHIYKCWHDAVGVRVPSGYSYALSNNDVPGAGGRVSAALQFMSHLRSGAIDLEKFIERCDEVATSEPIFNNRGAEAEAEKLKPWIRENLQKWMSPVDTTEVPA